MSSHKIAQSLANSFFVKNVSYITSTVSLIDQIFAPFLQFLNADKTKQSPNRRKIAQSGHQGCQKAYFQTKNLGSFWRAVEGKKLFFGIYYSYWVYIMVILKFSDNLVYCVKKNLATLLVTLSTSIHKR
jgi:hypothetical protein